MTRSRALRQRTAILGLLLVASAGACVRGSRQQPPAPQVTPPDTLVAQRDTATDSLARADSIARADSLARVTDSLARLKEDSIKRARGDSIERANPPARARPARECLFETIPDSTSRVLFRTHPDGSHDLFVGGGFTGTCQGENNTIKADSGEYYESAGIVNLYGNVEYSEPGKLTFTSHRANYFLREERLFAEGNVRAVQTSTGSTFVGNTMEYFRVRPGIRDVSRLYAPGRPSVYLMSRDSMNRPLPTVVITANTMEDRGDSVVFAWGLVMIDREQIKAQADSATFDRIRSQARLIRGAQVLSEQPGQEFTLTGDTIEMYTQERTLERVVALHAARAVNGDLTLTSENLDLRLVDQQLERAFAFGEGRSVAITPQQELEADSLAIFVTRRQLSEVHALGAARAIGVPDTTRIRTSDRDMLRADTIFARFDTTGIVDDTSQRADIEEIRAIGNASSLFHIASQRGPTYPPAINYSRGKRIFITFADSGVSNVRVDSSASGIFLEPIPDSLADTTRARTDTAPRVPPPLPPPDSLQVGAAGSAQRPRVPSPIPRRHSSNEFVALPTGFVRYD